MWHKSFRLKNNIDIAKRALQALTGKIPNKLATVRADLKVNNIKQNIQEWQTVASKKQPQCANSRRQYQADVSKTLILPKLVITLPWMRLLPTITLYSNGGQNGFGNDSESSVVGLELALPLYQGGGVNSRIRQAAYNKQKALDDLQLALRQTDLETQRAPT